jgi:hypothetical protein
MTLGRWAAVITWAYAAGFGLSTIPVAVYYLARGRLPIVFGMFPAYAGPWSVRFRPLPFAIVLSLFLLLSAVVAWSGWLLWNGQRSGAILMLALIPLEAVFWWGFALPIPPVMAAIRLGLVIASWNSLR